MANKEITSPCVTLALTNICKVQEQSRPWTESKINKINKIN